MPRPTHRIRRGKLVEIPKQWSGKVPSNQTLLKRKAMRIEQKARRKSRLLKEAKFHWDSQLGN